MPITRVIENCRSSGAKGSTSAKQPIFMAVGGFRRPKRFPQVALLRRHEIATPLTAIMICYTMPDLIHDGPFRRAPNGPCSGVPCPNTRQGPDPNEPSDFRSRQYKATRLLYLRLTSYAS